MKKFISTILSAALLLGLCGCAFGTAEDPMDAEQNNGTRTYITSDGAVVFERSMDNPTEEISGNIITRDTTEKDVSAPEGSISFEEAVRLTDACSYKELFLPTAVQNYQKHYFGTIEENGIPYYDIGFFLEKNSVRIFVGTELLVSCDGKSILKKDWTGSWMPLEEEGTSDISGNPFADVPSTPQDALFALTKVDSRKLGLSEGFFTYTYEIDTKLHERKSIKCYKITPKLEYENGLRYAAPIYVTADGTNRIMLHDDATDDYILIE